MGQRVNGWYVRKEHDEGPPAAFGPSTTALKDLWDRNNRRWHWYDQEDGNAYITVDGTGWNISLDRAYVYGRDCSRGRYYFQLDTLFDQFRSEKLTEKFPLRYRDPPAEGWQVFCAIRGNAPAPTLEVMPRVTTSDRLPWVPV